MPFPVLGGRQLWWVQIALPVPLPFTLVSVLSFLTPSLCLACPSPPGLGSCPRPSPRAVQHLLLSPSPAEVSRCPYLSLQLQLLQVAGPSLLPPVQHGWICSPCGLNTRKQALSAPTAQQRGARPRSFNRALTHTGVASAARGSSCSCLGGTGLLRSRQGPGQGGPSKTESLGFSLKRVVAGEVGLDSFRSNAFTWPHLHRFSWQ